MDQDGRPGRDEEEADDCRQDARAVPRVGPVHSWAWRVPPEWKRACGLSCLTEEACADSSSLHPQIVGNVGSHPVLLAFARALLTLPHAGPRRLELPVKLGREERGRVGGSRVRDVPRVVLAPRKGDGGGAQGGRLRAQRTLSLSLRSDRCVCSCSYRRCSTLSSPVLPFIPSLVCSAVRGDWPSRWRLPFDTGWPGERQYARRKWRKKSRSWFPS